MRFRFALLLIVPLASGPASAQFTLDWQPRESANANLPASIRVFESTTPNIPAWYIRADPADLGWRLKAVLSDSGTETLASFASGENAIVAINGGYFGGGQSYSLVRDGGTTLASNIGALTRSGQTYYPTRGAFGFSEARIPDVAWIYNVGGVQTAYPTPNNNREGAAPEAQPTAGFPAGGAPWNVSTAIGGGPVLVENGQVMLTWEEEVFFGGSGVDLTSTRARTAIGYDASGHILLFATLESRGLRLEELADIMVDIGAVEAVNLDGGGSTGMIAGSEQIRDTTRPVASALIIVDAHGEAETILDTGSAGYREEGAWFESANEPFYGDTPSRLLQVGAAGRAVFHLEGIADGAYLVDAWWVPAPNRAVDTAYLIYRDGVASTHRVDQSDASTAGRWNELSPALLSPGDSIVVTTDATAGTGATFVSVDAIRLTQIATPATERAPERPLALTAAPNPARGSVAVTLALPSPGLLHVDVIDALGRTVRQRRDASGGGEVRLDLDLAGLPSGVYTIRAMASGATDQTRITIVR